MKRVLPVMALLAVGAAAVLLTVFWGGSTAVNSARAAEGSSGTDIDRQVARFLGELAKSGYVSQSGTESVLEPDRRYCEGQLRSALWANPQSPYIISGIPAVPGQAPNTNEPFSWRLRQDEAIVMIGMTPPPVAYFGIEQWMVKGSLAALPVLQGSVGDPINHKTIRTTGSTPYDRPFALVVTGNQRTQAEVNKMLAASGLGGATNNVTIPPAMFRLGLGEGSDEFLGLLIRTAVPEPGFEKALEEYRAAPPLRVFRVRPEGNSADETKPVYPPDPLPVPQLRVSGTGTSELNLNPTLQLLRQRIVNTHPGYEAHDVLLRRGFEEAYPGLQSNLVTIPPVEGTAGYTSDANYLMSPNFSLPDGSFLVTYGPNHVATGKAAYTSLSLYADSEATVNMATKDHAELQGSARDFIADQQNADEFYSWTFTRAGSSGPQGPHVTPLPATDALYCERYGTDRPVDLGTVQLLSRVYMEPATKSRPALSELLLDRVLLFTPK